MKFDKYVDAMEKIEIPTDMQERILQKSLKHNKGAKYNMNIRKIKYVAIAVAAAFVLCMGALASNGIVNSWLKSSSAFDEFDSLPTHEEIVKKIGYDVKLKESFSNGFVFSDGNISKNALLDDENNTIEKFKSVDLRYTKGEEKLYLSEEKYISDNSDSEMITDENGMKYYYTNQPYKFVPVDYVMTEEDLARQESGECKYSFGSESVEENVVTSLSWSDGEITYNLMQYDGTLTKEDFVAVAQELMK